MAAMSLSSQPHVTSSASLRLPSASRTKIPSKTISYHFTHLRNPSIFSFPLRFNHTAKNPRRHLTLVVSAVGKLSETELVPVPPESDAVSALFPADSGVYAVHDNNGDLQFVGLSRNIQASVLYHLKYVPELCGSVKVGVVENPDRTSLTEAWKSWMEEHIQVTGKVPPGNESGNATWVRQQPKKKADLRFTPGRHVQLTVPLEDLIDRVVKENKVVAFIKGSRSAPQCGFSQRVVGILDSVGVEYESVDVLDEEHNSGLRETLKKYSSWPTFPQVFVNGELVGGCDILSSMHEKEVEQLLAPEERAILQQNQAPNIEKISTEKWNPLHTLGLAGQIKFMDSLLENGFDINAVDKDGQTALHKAVLGKKEAVISHLLRKGASPHVQDLDGATPLHYAVQVSAMQTVKLLIKSKVDDGWTPLHVAMQSRNRDIAKVLLVNGADKTRRTKDGKTPLDLALCYGKEFKAYDLAKLLKLVPANSYF